MGRSSGARRRLSRFVCRCMVLLAVPALAFGRHHVRWCFVVGFGLGLASVPGHTIPMPKMWRSIQFRLRLLSMRLAALRAGLTSHSSGRLRRRLIPALAGSSVTVLRVCFKLLFWPVSGVSLRPCSPHSLYKSSAHTVVRFRGSRLQMLRACPGQKKATAQGHQVAAV